MQEFIFFSLIWNDFKCNKLRPQERQRTEKF